MKLCKDCANSTYINGGLVGCSISYARPWDGHSSGLRLEEARGYEWACGASAKYFNPRKPDADREKAFVETCKTMRDSGGRCAEIICTRCPFYCKYNKHKEGCIRAGYKAECDSNKEDITLVCSAKTWLRNHLVAFLKSRAGEYITLADYVEHGGDAEDFKACGVDSIEYLWWNMGGSYEWRQAWEEQLDPKDKYRLRIRITPEGTLPQRDWRESIPWKEAPEWATHFAFDGYRRAYWYGKPVLSECVNGFRYTWQQVKGMTRPENVDWRETLTPRPEEV